MLHRILFFLSFGLFIWSLFLPVYAEKEGLPAYFALFGGWMVGINDIPTAISWFANITYLLAIFTIIKRKKLKAKSALVYSIISILLACCFLLAGKAFTGSNVSEVTSKLSPGMAFYVWLSAFVVMAIASYLKLKARSEVKDTVESSHQ